MQKEKKRTEGRKFVEEKKKLIATVLEITHGGLFGSHKHYDIKVLELPERFTTDDIERAALKATKTGRQLGIRVEVLAVKEVEITTREMMKEKVSKFLSEQE